MHRARRYFGGLAILLATGVVVVACGQGATPTPTATDPASQVATRAPPTATSTPTMPVAPTPTPTREYEALHKRFGSRVTDYAWRTDFSKHSVPFEEIKYFGLWRDAIIPITKPVFQTFDEANERVIDLEPVIVVEIGGEARAYPQRTFTAHEVVNDVLGGVPIAVTW